MIPFAVGKRVVAFAPITRSTYTKRNPEFYDFRHGRCYQSDLNTQRTYINNAFRIHVSIRF